MAEFRPTSIREVRRARFRTCKLPREERRADFRPRFWLPELSSGATLQLELQLPWWGCCRVLDRSEFERAERLSKGRSRASCTPGRADLARPA